MFQQSQAIILLLHVRTQQSGKSSTIRESNQASGAHITLSTMYEKSSILLVETGVKKKIVL